MPAPGLPFAFALSSPGGAVLGKPQTAQLKYSLQRRSLNGARPSSLKRDIPGILFHRRLEERTRPVRRGSEGAVHFSGVAPPSVFRIVAAKLWNPAPGSGRKYTLFCCNIYLIVKYIAWWALDFASLGSNNGPFLIQNCYGPTANIMVCFQWDGLHAELGWS